MEERDLRRVRAYKGDFTSTTANERRDVVYRRADEGVRPYVLLDPTTCFDCWNASRTGT